MKKIAAVRFAAFFLVSLMILPSVREKRKKDIFLSAEYNAGYGLIMLDVVCAEFDVCGLLLKIDYDEELLELTSAIRREAKPSLDFSASLKGGGEEVLLFDGEENDSSGGRLATLCFKLKKRSTLRFTLSCPDGESAYSIGEAGFEEIDIEEDLLVFEPVGCRLYDRFFNTFKRFCGV